MNETIMRKSLATCLLAAQRAALRLVVCHLLGICLVILVYDDWSVRAAELYDNTNGAVAQDTSDILFDPLTIQPLRLIINPADWQRIREQEDT